MRRPMSRLALRNRRLMIAGVNARAENAAWHAMRERAQAASRARDAEERDIAAWQPSDPDPIEQAGWKPEGLEPRNLED